MAVLWISASSFLHVILCKKLSGSRRIHGPLSPGSSGTFGLGKFSVLEAVFSCIGLVITAPFPGQSFPSGYSVGPRGLPEHWWSCCEPQPKAGILEAPLAAPENQVSLRLGKSRSLTETYAEQKIVLEDFEFCLSGSFPRKLWPWEQKGSSFHEEGPRWVVAARPRDGSA